MLMERRLAVLHEEIGLEAGEPTRGVDEAAKVTRKRVGYVRRDVGRSAVPWGRSEETREGVE